MLEQREARFVARPSPKGRGQRLILLREAGDRREPWGMAVLGAQKSPKTLHSDNILTQTPGLRPATNIKHA